MQILRKIQFSILCLVIVACAEAQNVRFVSGSFTEKVMAEVWLNRIDGAKKFTRLAEFRISPGEENFAFSIPDDLDASYRLQVNLYKPGGGRHPKFDRIIDVPLFFEVDKNYTLTITPSKFDTAKKTGWQLKEDAKKSTLALISGKILSAPMKTGVPLSLQSVEDGTMVSTNSFMTGSDGRFKIPCRVKQEGFYYLTSVRWRVRIYLKPAERLELNIDNMTGTSIFVSGSDENRSLNKWQQLILPITRYGYNLSSIYVDSIDLNSYISTYEELRPAMDAFSKNFDWTNAPFAKAFKNAMNLDRELAPLNFLFYYSVKGIKGWRPNPKDFKEVPVFYTQFVQPSKFSSTSILVLGEARQFINLYAKLNLALLTKEEREKLSEAEKLKLMMNAISNDTLKSLFLNDKMGQMEINNLSEFKENILPFKKYAMMEPAKTTYQNIYGLFRGDTAFVGKSSYNFSLPDTEGKMVSMKDFKGKVVFIDVWATWCGPCRAQFPFMKEIEEEYANNKDIVFVGISLDKAEVRKKWQDMIKKEQLGGVQLIDDFGKSFGRKYGLTAIPRFMLIDRQGRWIEIRCPLPEAKDNLKKYLNKALAN